MKRKRKPKRNKQAVQEIYNRVNGPRNISAIEALGLKSCLYCDLFGTFSVENISDTDVYIQVKSKLQDLCGYALNAKSEPVAKDFNIGDSDVTVRNPNAQLVDPRSSLEDAASALRALQDTLQKDVFDKLETVLESLTEAQKD